MSSKRNIIQYFASKFISSNKKVIFIVLISFISMLSKTAGKLGLQRISNIIFYSEPNDIKNETHMYIYIFTSIFYSITLPIYDIIIHHFDFYMMVSVFPLFYNSFIKYQYIDWKKYVQSDLYTAIIRRTKGTIQFFKQILIESVDHLLYIALGTLKLLFLYGFPKYFILGFSLIFGFPIFLNIFTILRTKILRKSNEAYDISENRLKDIFMNYEMIHTYNMVEEEIINYEKSYYNWKFWFITYWIINDFIEILSKGLKVIFLLILHSSSINIKEYNLEEKIDQMKTFNSILKRMYLFTTSIKLVLEASENMCYSKLDDLESEDKKDHNTNAIKSGNVDHIKETNSNDIKDVKEIRSNDIKDVDDINFNAIRSTNLFDREISVKDMKMIYGSNLIFEKVNLKFVKGEKVAIIGPNGSGKSTFIKGLLGIERSEGEIKVDGISSKSIRREEWNEMFGYVPQEAAIFEATVLDNIIFFNNKIPLEEVVKRINEFNMHEDMKRIGYNTVLVERGRNIGAAQRQKICFLRAMVKKAPILVFDEVTSEMDQEYERKLIEMVIKKGDGVTVIMIIHNLDLLNKFDKIVFFGAHGAISGNSCEDLERKSIIFKDFYRVKNN